jgi:hypothetical protein
LAVSRRLIEFSRFETDEVDEALARMPDGAWVNIEPIVEQDDLDDLRERTPHPLLRIFSAKGAPIPFGTVVAQQDGLAVGLEHSRGRRVLPELRELNIVAPESWRQQQDHAKRGVVYLAPRDEDPKVVVAWICAAATALTAVPIRGNWSAMVATPS